MPTQTQRVLTADARRRITLPPALGVEPGDSFRAVKEIDGRITLHPVVWIEEADAS